MHKAKWYRIDAILGKPNQSLRAKMMVVTQAELARWITAHLEQGYTVTLTKAETLQPSVPERIEASHCNVN